MYPDTCDDWHQDDVECVQLQEDYLTTIASIVYGPESNWTKKDLLDYNRIFEGLE